MDNLNRIVKNCLTEEKYFVNEILNLPKGFLKIKIENNIPYIIDCEKLYNGEIEQRQHSIFKMISNLCKIKKIPDLIFTYCTHDRPPFDGPFFTHARIRGSQTKTILSPCFTFESYPEGPDSVLTKYPETFEKLILNNKITWNDKKDSVIFVGHIGQNNNRLDNTTLSMNEKISLSLFNQQSTSNNFISRESLNKYKFLLHLNGNNGAYASRLKYLLGTEGLVFYNYNSGNETNLWEEWWMDKDYFIDGHHYILCENKKEFEHKINYYYNNQNESKKIASNGFNFFKENLNHDSVLEFWYCLLNEYSKRLIY